jgi:hypothetical protein
VVLHGKVFVNGHSLFLLALNWPLLARHRLQLCEQGEWREAALSGRAGRWLTGRSFRRTGFDLVRFSPP